MEPIYVVSSFQRSGGSMLARCLHKGGIGANFNPIMDQENILPDDPSYVPNPGGFFQANDEEVLACPSFYKGKLVKVHLQTLLRLSPEDVKVVFISRHPEEIDASMKKFLPFGFDRDAAAIQFMDQILPAIQKRMGASLRVVWYSDVVGSPVEEMQNIKDFGFPIDVQKAATEVNPSLHRHKLEKK